MPGYKLANAIDSPHLPSESASVKLAPDSRQSVLPALHKLYALFSRDVLAHPDRECRKSRAGEIIQTDRKRASVYRDDSVLYVWIHKYCVLIQELLLLQSTNYTSAVFSPNLTSCAKLPHSAELIGIFFFFFYFILKGTKNLSQNLAMPE